MKVDPTELVTVKDIATELRVGLSAVSNWPKRHADFPKPVVTVAGGRTPLWLRSEVLAWHAQRKQARAGDIEARIAQLRARAKALEESIQKP